MHRLLLVFLLTTPLALLAQNAQIDSLRGVLQETTGAQRIRPLQDLAIAYLYVDPSEGLPYAKESYALAEQHDSVLLQARAANVTGASLRVGGDLKAGLKWAHHCVELYEQADSPSLLPALNNLSLAYSDLGEYTTADSLIRLAIRKAEKMKVNPNELINYKVNRAGVLALTGGYEKALELYYEVIDFYIQDKDYKNLASTYGDLGLLYDRMMKYEDAIRSYDIAQRIFTHLDDRRGISREVRHKAMTYHEMEEFELAERLGREGIALAQPLNDAEGLMEAYNVLGGTFWQMGKQDSAIKYYSIGDSIAVRHGFNEASGANILTRGMIAYAEARYKDAETHLREAIALARGARDLPNLWEAQHFLALALRQMGRGNEAFDYYEKSITLHDSLYSKETAERIGRLNAEHDQRVAQIQAEMAEEADERARRRTTNQQYLLAAVVLLVLLVGAFSVSRLRINPRVQEALLFFTMLIIIEFLIITIDPLIIAYTDGLPIPTLIANAILAIAFTSLHRVLDQRMIKKRASKAEDPTDSAG